MDTELEIQIFKIFIAKNRQDRFEWNLSSAKRRTKIFDDLRDTRHFDESKLTEVDGADSILDFLKSKNVTKKIYIVSSDEDLDGKTVTIDRLKETDFWESQEIVGYSKAAKVGFFKNHEDWFYLIK